MTQIVPLVQYSDHRLNIRLVCNSDPHCKTEQNGGHIVFGPLENRTSKLPIFVIQAPTVNEHFFQRKSRRGPCLTGHANGHGGWGDGQMGGRTSDRVANVHRWRHPWTLEVSLKDYVKYLHSGDLNIKNRSGTYRVKVFSFSSVGFITWLFY